jgi:WD40-like Beta Propeller Repeat
MTAAASTLVACGAGSAAPRADASRLASRFLVVASQQATLATPQLEIVGTDGHLHRLLGLDVGSVALSPNGRWIAWAGPGGIHVERRGGSHRRLLVFAHCPAAYKTCVGAPFVWSPDSQKLLFTKVSPKPGTAGLAMVSLASGAIRQIVAPRKHVTYTPLGWSRRANEILFTANNSGGANGIGCCSEKLIIASPSGAHQRTLYNAADPIHDSPAVSWSPNGKWISFTTDGRDTRDPRLAIITAATGVMKRVGSFDGFTEPPVWSPDSHRFTIGGYQTALQTYSPTGKTLGSLPPTSADVRAWTSGGIYYVRAAPALPRRLFVIPNAQRSGRPLFTLPGHQVFVTVKPMQPSPTGNAAIPGV